jgi:peptidoglycan/LPS O-acetylase OafA/YrhL
VSKTYTLKCAAYNLGLLLRKVWGYCKPRNAAAGAAPFLAFLLLLATVAVITGDRISSRMDACALLIAVALATAAIRYFLNSRKKSVT